MAKSIQVKLQESKKWLEKNAQANLSLKSAQAFLASAEKSVAEVALLKRKQEEAIQAREAAMDALDSAMAKAKLEKKLKAKDAKLQTKIASLSSPEK
jgi:hypothetical protein